VVGCNYFLIAVELNWEAESTREVNMTYRELIVISCKFCLHSWADICEPYGTNCINIGLYYGEIQRFINSQVLKTGF
jgi:hypothetical protein